MKAHSVLDLITFFLDANASPQAKRSPTVIVGLSSTLPQALLIFLEGDLPSKPPLYVLPRLKIKCTGRHERTWLFENVKSPFNL